MHIKDLNEIVTDYANTHKLIGYNEQILRRWLKNSNQVEEILSDIFALKEWKSQRKKGYIARLIKYVNAQAIDILNEHDKPISVQKLVPKILGGKGFKKGMYSSCQRRPNLIEYILAHHFTSPLVLLNGEFSLREAPENPPEKKQSWNDTEAVIDEKFIKQAKPYDSKSVLEQGTYVIHPSLGIGFISAVLNSYQKLKYEINFENRGKVMVVAENVRLKVIPDSRGFSQTDESDEITPQRQITDIQKFEIISESPSPIEQKKPEKSNQYDGELEKLRHTLDSIEPYQESEQEESTYQEVQKIDSWFQERSSK